MPDVDTLKPTIVRTERGLSITGTRITLYDVIGYLRAGWPAPHIQNGLNLSAAQLAEAMDYIAEHRQEVEAEYQTVMEHAQANRAYWEARNWQRLRRVAARPVAPEQNAIRAKIKAHKAKLGMP